AAGRSDSSEDLNGDVVICERGGCGRGSVRGGRFGLLFGRHGCGLLLGDDGGLGGGLGRNGRLGRGRLRGDGSGLRRSRGGRRRRRGLRRRDGRLGGCLGRSGHALELRLQLFQAQIFVGRRRGRLGRGLGSRGCCRLRGGRRLGGDGRLGRSRRRLGSGRLRRSRGGLRRGLGGRHRLLGRRGRRLLGLLGHLFLRFCFCLHLGRLLGHLFLRLRGLLGRLLGCLFLRGGFLRLGLRLGRRLLGQVDGHGAVFHAILATRLDALLGVLDGLLLRLRL